MNLRHIEAYRAVSVTGSMTAAAQRVHTSQPQISRLISQLEGITGFALFHRNGSRLSATAEGARFFADVEKTFAGLAALEAAAARIRCFSASRLAVAAMPRLAGGLLAHAVVRFKQQYPDTMLSVHSGDDASVNAWIGSGQCDLGVAMLYTDMPGVRIEPICSIDCVAILPIGHPLAQHEQILPEHFDGQRFISFPADTPLRERVDAVFAEHDVRPYVTAEASLGSSICALVAAGQGISLINRLAAEEERLLVGLELRPFLPNIPLQIVLMYPEHSGQSRLVSTFADCARQVILEEIDAKAGAVRTGAANGRGPRRIDPQLSR